MKVLLVGSGAREHALFWKLSHSEIVTDLSVWPGGAAMVGAKSCRFTKNDNLG